MELLSFSGQTSFHLSSVCLFLTLTTFVYQHIQSGRFTFTEEKKVEGKKEKFQEENPWGIEYEKTHRFGLHSYVPFVCLRYVLFSPFEKLDGGEQFRHIHTIMIFGFSTFFPVSFSLCSLFFLLFIFTRKLESERTLCCLHPSFLRHSLTFIFLVLLPVFSC